MGLLAAPVLVGVAAWAVMARWPRQLTKVESDARDSMLRSVLATTTVKRGGQWTGRTVSTATDGIERSANYRVVFLGPMIAAMTSPLLVTLVIGFAIDWVAALWLMVALPAIPILIGGFQSAFRRVSSRYRAASRRLVARYLDAIQGLMTLRSLGAGRRVGKSLAAEAENVRAHVMRLLAGNQLVLLVTDAAFSLGMLTLAAGMAIGRSATGNITPGQAVALVLISTLLLEPLDRIGQFFYIGMGGMAAQREIKQFIADNPTTEPSHATSRSRRRNRAETPRVVTSAGTAPSEDELRAAGQPEVEVADVTFGYTDTPVLKGLNFTVAPGEHVAIMGPSGGGKSTLLGLIQGLLVPQSGSVALRGTVLSDAYGGWSTAQCATVAQSTYLFTGTLAQNLRIAAPGASEDDLYDALRVANFGEVHDWPDGLATQVGERGLSLSGGQAQRVAIARAVLKDAPILILDEPTSSVDLANERLILDALETLTRDRTVIAVTHRVATALAADRVLELRDGVLRGLDLEVAL